MKRYAPKTRKIFFCFFYVNFVADKKNSLCSEAVFIIDKVSYEEQLLPAVYLYPGLQEIHLSVSLAQEAHPVYKHLVLTPLTQVYPVMFPDGQVDPLEPEEDDDPPLDPVQTPDCEQLVQVLLLPT